MRILLLNKFTAPDPAPTARLLEELGEELKRLGWEVVSCGAGGNYRKGTGSGWRRWWREALAHFKLFVSGCRARRPNIILCLSDPPGLVFTAAVLALLRRVPLAHWVMDAYPQTAAALGEVSPKSIPYRVLNSAVRVGYRRCQLVACLDMDMADALHLRGDARLHVCPPWPAAGPIFDPLPAIELPVEGVGTGFSWLYSGNLGRAHEFETLLQAQRLLEQQGVEAWLVFQGSGPMMPMARRRAEELGLSRCLWRDYVPEHCLVASLLQANVLIATQKAETLGLLWPSKLALLKFLDRPLLWVGPPDGEIARMLRCGRPDTGIFAPGESQAVAEWILRRPRRGGIALSQSSRRKQITYEKAHAAEQWHHRLLALITTPKDPF